MKSTYPFRTYEHILPVLAHNLFIGSAGLDGYDESASPNTMAGNIFLNGAKPSRHEDSPVVMQDFDPALRLREENGAWFLDLNVGWPTAATGPRVTSELLGKTLVSRQPFVDPDGSPFQLDQDFHGKARTGATSSPGPFEGLREGKQTLQLPARP